MLTALLAVPFPASAGLVQSSEPLHRLAHPIDIPDGPTLPANATIGQITLNTFERLQRLHGRSLPNLGEAFLCKSGTADLVRSATTTILKARGKADRAAIRAGDAAITMQVATEVAGVLDGVDPAAIRADEAIGPGVYHDGVVGLAYVISRCHFS